MDKKETKFCIYCGEEIPISAKKCKYCYEWIDDDSVSRNHDPAIYKSETNENKEEIQKEGLKQEKYPGEEEYYKNEKIAISSSKIKSQNKEEYSKIIPIRRLFLLITFTFGLYGYYWYYKNTSYLKDYLGMDIRVGLRTFFMFIPIVNIIFFYQLLEDMKNFIQGEGIESYSSGLNTLIWLFLGSWFGTLGMWTLINVQESINEFWRKREPNLPIRRSFSNGEILIMLLGIILVIFIIVIYMALFLNIFSSMTPYPYY